MSTKINLRDIGWMYHAPPKGNVKDEIRVPPTSQIPGLGNMPDDAFTDDLDKLRNNLFKSTDTPYITMAKMGGRADLLQIQQPSEEYQEPVGYPRCEWFYLEDNALEDAHRNSGQYVSRQPDYMVHEAYGGNESEHEDNCGSQIMGRPQGRVPYAVDTRRAAEVNSQSSKKIMEPRPSGYGVRTEKAKDLQARRQAKTGKNSSSGQTGNAIMVHGQGQHKIPDALIMSKLISNGYAHEWDEQKQRLQKENASKGPMEPREKIATTTEYSEMYEASAGHRKPPRETHAKSDKAGKKPAKKPTGK